MKLIHTLDVDLKPFHHGAVRTLTMCLWQHPTGALYRTEHEREEHPTLTGIDWHEGTLYQPSIDGRCGRPQRGRGTPIERWCTPLFTKHIRMASTTDMHKALLAEIPE